MDIAEYRSTLAEYLKNRMRAVAPNLTILVGELVAAKLIAHAGSLINLAKMPASTIQILGAEKALFRAMKTKHNTPKYGLIYNCSLVGQAKQKLKGKISRSLAAKCALCVRYDALGEEVDGRLGVQHKAYMDMKLRHFDPELRGLGAVPETKKVQKYEKGSTKTPQYSAEADFTAAPAKAEKPEKKKKKKKAAVEEEEEED